jgi:hypothetical protein
MDPYFQSDDIKLTDLIRGIRDYSWYVIKRFYIVIGAAILLYYGGRWFANISEKQWVAYTSFNAVDARSAGGFGGLMSLASSMGFGIGGGSSNDVLSGIFSSRNVIKSSFLQEIDYYGRKEKIINLFLEKLGYMDVYANTPGMETFKFTAPDIFRLSYTEDSILNAVYNMFVEDYFEIEFDPLAGLIKAGVYSPDRLISMRLCESMLKKTNEFYAVSSNQKAMDSYNKLTRKVDSIAAALNNKNLIMASIKDQNIFNKKEQGLVDISELTRDITVLNIQYNDAISSLEAAKAAIASEAQVMRIVDVPAFSTMIDERDPDFWGLIGLFVGIGLSIIVLCIVKASSDAFKEEKILQQKANTSIS